MAITRRVALKDEWQTSISRALQPAPQAEGGFLHGTDEPGRFAWIHRPAFATGAALVIVPPFGYEAVCAHRSLRHLADAAARAGMLAVRVDLDGTGDSIGSDLDPDRLEAWLATIRDTCDLARSAGASRLVLAGVRLGASLATLAAAERHDVVGLVAIAAVPRGAALVREGRALQMALGLSPPPPGLPPVADDVHEVAGFALTDATRTALARIDLMTTRRSPAPSMLVVDRDDFAPNNEWVEILRQLGTEVVHQRLPGYVEMMLDPHCTEVPRAICDATVTFASTRPPLAHVTNTPRVALRSKAVLDGITEELVEIDDGHPLTAIASSRGLSHARAVILLNAGATHRVGPNRLHVALARTLAAQGMLAVRLDQSGLGDSPPRAKAAENVVYSEHAVADVAAAVAWVRGRGAKHVTVIGLCSGAYHAIRAAVAGLPIDTIVSINPLTFRWKPGMPLDFAAFRIASDTRRYRRSVRSSESWRKLLRGDVDLVRATRVLATRVQTAVEHTARDVFRRLHVRLRDDLGSDLSTLARRGVAMHFVFAANDPGRTMLFEQGGSVVTRLERAGALTIDIIPNADHTFTPRWSHPVLISTIVRALTRVSSPR